MPVTANSPAPYAPAAAILEVVKRHRMRGMPSPINAEVLARSGVSDSLIPRTIQALKTLDLIDEEGRPTETLEGLRLAPEGEYPSRLEQWLNGAYADVLNFIDPSTADETALRDAFRSYKPVGQQSRMVSLFIGLYGAAGIGPEKGGTPRSTRRSRSASPQALNGNGKPKPTVYASSRPGTAEDTAAQPRPTHSDESGGQPQNNQPQTSRYRVAYDAITAVWEPEDMGDEVDAAVVTLLRYLRKKETETKA